MIEGYMCECNGVCELKIESEIYERLSNSGVIRGGKGGVYIRHPECLNLIEEGDIIIEQTDKYVLIKHKSKDIE